MHPEYADIGAPASDPAAAIALIEEAGVAAHEHVLISLDDDWNRASADAIAAQLRDAGITVRREIQPGDVFWAGWRTHRFSCTQWNMRPLGVQILALAYTSYGQWNETGIADPDLDADIQVALGIPEPDARRDVMARIEARLIADGTIEPGKVFDLTLPLDQAAEGYRAMDERRAIKTLLTL